MSDGIDQVRLRFVREVIGEQIGIDPAAVQNRLLGDDLGLDGLDLVEVAIKVETMCDVAVSGEMGWRRPSDIVRAIADAKAA